MKKLWLNCQLWANLCTERKMIHNEQRFERIVIYLAIWTLKGHRLKDKYKVW